MSLPILPRRSRGPNRRAVLSAGAAFGALMAAPSILRAGAAPAFLHGVQSGDIGARGGVVWTRADRPARLLLEVATTDSFTDARRVAMLDALPESDFAVKCLVEGLPAEQTCFYRFTATDLTDANAVSEPVVGRFRAAPTTRRTVRFAWSGDTAGQGWGIPEEGMTTYATMAGHELDFFLHSGDTIYADGPIKAEQEHAGGVWKNAILIPEVEKVAETLDEFRGRYKYNLMDRHVRALAAQVPTIYQWDDHEVLNNWSPGKDLGADDRYAVKSIDLLRARAARAFHEMNPVAYVPAEPGRVFRKIGWGPLLDVFVMDLRSYRGANGESREAALTPESRILGEAQVAWLKQGLKQSTATWKVLACDMPVGVVIWDDYKVAAGAEGVANGDAGAASGRELEFADLLRFIRDEKIANTV